MKIKDYLIQKENQLITEKNCEIIIDLNDYDLDDNITIEDEYVSVEILISQIIFDDSFKFNLILDYPVNFNPIEMKLDKKNNILHMFFDAGSVILNVTYSVSGQKKTNYLERLFGGRELFKDTEHLFKKIVSLYSPPDSNMDIVHLEVLISQLLRDKNKPNLPARLGSTWNPKMMNIKELVFTSGFLNSLAFENVNKALITGLTSNDKLEKSILEKVLDGSIHDIGKPKEEY